MWKRKANAQPTCNRRAHSEQFKREAVKLAFDQQLSVAEAARNRGIHPSGLIRVPSQNTCRTASSSKMLRIASGWRNHLPLDAGGLALLGCRARYALARPRGKACLSPSSCVLHHTPPYFCLELFPSREVRASGVAGRTTQEQELPHKRSARGQRCNRRASRRPKRGSAAAARPLVWARLPLSRDRYA